MTYKLKCELVALERWNSAKSKFTRRKLYYLYRYGDASILVECWGWEPGKGYAKAIRSLAALKDELARRCSKEAITHWSSKLYRLVPCETDRELTFANDALLTQHLESMVGADKCAEISVGHFARFHARAVDGFTDEERAELDEKSFVDFWPLAGLESPAALEDLFDVGDAPSVKDIELRQVALADTYGDEWGGFA